MHANKEFDFNRPEPSSTGPTQAGGKQWSMSALRAARPNPKYDNWAAAMDWNHTYAKYPELQVEVSDFREVVPEHTQAEIEANLKRINQHWYDSMGKDSKAQDKE